MKITANIVYSYLNQIAQPYVDVALHMLVFIIPRHNSSVSGLHCAPLGYYCRLVCSHLELGAISLVF